MADAKSTRLNSSFLIPWSHTSVIKCKFRSNNVNISPKLTRQVYNLFQDLWNWFNISTAHLEEQCSSGGCKVPWVQSTFGPKAKQIIFQTYF